MKARNILIFFIFFLCSCVTTGMKSFDKSNAHYQMGVSYFKENKIQMAYVEFQKAIELNPNNKEAQNALGVVYLKFDDPQKAKDSFSKAVIIDPNFSEAQNNLGSTYGTMGKWSEAVNSFKAALKNPLYKTSETAYRNLGLAYYRLGRIDEAINAYNESIKRAQDYYPSYYGLALCYNTKGQYGNAATAFTRAVELDPTFGGKKDKVAKYFENQRLMAKGDELKDIMDYLEIMKY
jgi:type IV pilus biogenesis/stability protein PilW